MRKNTDTLKEYVKKLNDEDLKFIGSRLSQRLGGDIGEVVEKVQTYQDVDRWLSTAGSAFEFFDIIDQLDGYIQQETKKRFSIQSAKK